MNCIFDLVVAKAPILNMKQINVACMVALRVHTLVFNCREGDMSRRRANNTVAGKVVGLNLKEHL